jgi:5-aminopentanamidase
MKLAIVQFSPKFGEKQKNIEKILNYILSIEVDIIVFPELATTGYFFLSRDEVKAVAETQESDFILTLQALSTESDKIIVCGVPEADGDKLYNSAAIITPFPLLTRFYRKTHLFYKEKFCFDEGDTGFFVVDFKSWDLKLGTMLCYDWRFPESARSLALLGADLIVCPSNLITNLWQKAMPVRALENKVYLACANRYGIETRNNEELLFKGESAIYDYEGEILAKAPSAEETVLISVISPQMTRDKSFNSFNDVFKDRRPEKYVYN